MAYYTVSHDQVRGSVSSRVELRKLSWPAFPGQLSLKWLSGKMQWKSEGGWWYYWPHYPLSVAAKEARSALKIGKDLGAILCGAVLNRLCSQSGQDSRIGMSLHRCWAQGKVLHSSVIQVLGKEEKSFLSLHGDDTPVMCQEESQKWHMSTCFQSYCCFLFPV